MLKLRYECRNNEWAEHNDSFNYGSHKAHCIVDSANKIVKVSKTKKDALTYLRKQIE